MSYFSDILSKHIKESGITIKYLSQISGFESSHITKFRNGSRKPNSEEKFKILVNALQLSPADQERLMNAYYIEHIGEEKYSQYMAVVELLESCDKLPKIQVLSHYNHDLSNISVVEGDNNVVNVMSMVMEKECNRANGEFSVMAQPSNNNLMNLLFKSVVNHPGVKVRHIVQLMALQKDSASTIHNVNCAREMLFLMRQSSRYSPYYYYEKNIVYRDNLMLLPNIIITSENVLCISGNYEYAVLHNDSNIIDFYRNLFETQLEKCSSFGTLYSTLIDTMSNGQSVYAKAENKCATVLEFQPCLTPFMKPEYIQKFLKNPGVLNEVLVKFFSEYLITLKSFYMIDCFSLEGIKEFLQCGVLMYLRTTMNPFPPEERKKIVLEMLETVERNEREIHIVKPSFMEITKSLSILCVNNHDVSMELCYPNDELNSLTFSEQNINNAVGEFMNFLPDSPFVYSNEESVQIVKELINRI